MPRRPARRCRANKQDGTPCPLPARPGKQECWVHDPDLADERADGRRRGGVSRSDALKGTLPPDTPDLPLNTVGDVANALARTVNEVRTGRVDARVGNCLGVLAGVLLRAIEGSELEQRVAALETRGARKTA